MPKKVTDKNGNPVLDMVGEGKKAIIPCQLIINLAMQENRTAESVRMSVRKTDIDPDGNIDYANADTSQSSITMPVDKLVQALGAEKVQQLTNLTRDIYNAITDYIVNPPVVEEVI